MRKMNWLTVFNNEFIFLDGCNQFVKNLSLFSSESFQHSSKQIMINKDNYFFIFPRDSEKFRKLYVLF